MFSEASLHSVHGGRQAAPPTIWAETPGGGRQADPPDRDPMDRDPSGKNMGPDRK